MSMVGNSWCVVPGQSRLYGTPLLLVCAVREQNRLTILRFFFFSQDSQGQIQRGREQGAARKQDPQSAQQVPHQESLWQPKAQYVPHVELGGSLSPFLYQHPFFQTPLTITTCYHYQRPAFSEFWPRVGLFLFLILSLSTGVYTFLLVAPYGGILASCSHYEARFFSMRANLLLHCVAVDKGG